MTLNDMADACEARIAAACVLDSAWWYVIVEQGGSTTAIGGMSAEIAARVFDREARRLAAKGVDFQIYFDVRGRNY